MEPPAHPDAPDKNPSDDTSEAPESARKHPTSEDLEVSSYLEATLEGEPRPETPPVHPQTVIVLDFGSQFSMLIARRIREAGVYSELVPYDASWDDVSKLNPAGFILSGGPASVYDEGAPQIPAYVFDSGLPILGICYGMQLLGLVEGAGLLQHLPEDRPGCQEHGGNALHPVSLAAESKLARLLGVEQTDVVSRHHQALERAPEGWSVAATDDEGLIEAIERDAAPFAIGVQWHPELAPEGSCQDRLFRGLVGAAGISAHALGFQNQPS